MRVKSKILHAARVFQAAKTHELESIIGVYIQDGSVQASNGKNFIIMESEHKNDLFIDYPMTIDIKKAIPAKAEFTELYEKNNKVILEHYCEAGKLIAIDYADRAFGKFPNLKKQMPAKSGKSVPPMPLNIWGLFAKAFKKGDAHLTIYGAETEFNFLKGNMFTFDERTNYAYGNPIVVCRVGTPQ